MDTQAIVFRRENEPHLETIPLPKLGPKDLLVDIHYSGISQGTEASLFSGTRTHNGTFPFVGGYMAGGVVQDVGPQVTQYKKGQRVLARRGEMVPGLNCVWGTHAAHAVCPEDCAYPLPNGLDLDLAAMGTLPGVGLNALECAGLTHKDRVLIFGQGLIGQFFGQYAKLRGAQVITVEPNPLRAKLSRDLVTPHVLDPKEDVGARVCQITDGKGPTMVVEGTANPRLIAQATAHLKMHSKMVFLSWYPGEISLPYAHFHNHEVSAYFPMGGGTEETVRTTLDLLAKGTLKMRENITHTVPHTEAVAGYEAFVNKDPEVMGMVIDWRGAK